MDAAAYPQPCRYSDLRRFVPALSDKMLTERLRDLISSGLVARKIGATAGSPVYVLTARGRSLSAALKELWRMG